MKFIVIKSLDVTHLNLEEMGTFAKLVSKIEEGRKAEGKQENTYLVINTDEPYADEVIEIMKRHEHWGNTSEDKEEDTLLYTIIINGLEKEISGFEDTLTYQRICELAEKPFRPFYTVTWSRGRGTNKEKGIITDGEKVKVTDGMRINVDLTNNA